jgi:UDP-N-acetyl-D-mannosaminuronic acid dehydrogenase
LKRVNVIGVGYIGLPTAGILASNGFDVLAVDTDIGVIDKLQTRNFNFVEPGLNDILVSALKSEKLTASINPSKSDVFIIAVPTPFKEDHQSDLRFVFSAVDSIIPFLGPGNLVIIESTVPMGTTEEIAKTIEAKRPDLTIGTSYNSIFLAHCPERVLPGQILKELKENSRIIGGINPSSTIKAINFYQEFVKGELFPTNSKTAELSKLAENTYRDVNIALANEFSLVCQQNGIDVWEMIRLANRHPRVNILNPGPGVGGHCIAVDPWFIIENAPEQTKLIRGAREVNDSMPSHVVNEITRLADKFTSPVIACLGLTYKPNVSDFRESPALEIITSLAGEPNNVILVVEPYVEQVDTLFSTFHNVHLRNLEDAISEANIIVVLVAHNQFLHIDQTKISEKIVVDKVGVWRK